MKLAYAFATCFAISECKLGDPNDEPIYAESDRPVNFRAPIAENIKG